MELLGMVASVLEPGGLGWGMTITLATGLLGPSHWDLKAGQSMVWGSLEAEECMLERMYKSIQLPIYSLLNLPLPITMDVLDSASAIRVKEEEKG